MNSVRIGVAGVALAYGGAACGLSQKDVNNSIATAQATEQANFNKALDATSSKIINQLKPTPTPSIAATASVEGKASAAATAEATASETSGNITTPVADNSIGNDIELKKGDEVDVTAIAIAQGDFTVTDRSESVNYVSPDTDQNTGEITVLLDGSARVHGTNAGDIQTQISKSSESNVLQQDIAAMQANGCVDGCDDVQVFTISGGQVSEQDYKKQVVAPTATSAPAATEQPTPTQSASTPVDFEIKAGDTKEVNGECVIQGDVKVNGEVYYDSNPNSGLEIVNTKGTIKVTAPWGADVYCNNNVTELAAAVAKFHDQMKQSGCVNGQGCDIVDIVTLPGGQPQGN